MQHFHGPHFAAAWSFSQWHYFFFSSKSVTLCYWWLVVQDQNPLGLMHSGSFGQNFLAKICFTSITNSMGKLLSSSIPWILHFDQVLLYEFIMFWDKLSKNLDILKSYEPNMRSAICLFSSMSSQAPSRTPASTDLHVWAHNWHWSSQTSYRGW